MPCSKSASAAGFVRRTANSYDREIRHDAGALLSPPDSGPVPGGVRFPGRGPDPRSDHACTYRPDASPPHHAPPRPPPPPPAPPARAPRRRPREPLPPPTGIRPFPTPLEIVGRELGLEEAV